MKVDQLKEYIAKVVREEVRKAVRDEVKNCISEAFGASSSVNQSRREVQVSENPSNSSFASLMENDDIEQTPQQPQTSKKKVQYTKNPVLNAVLNETAQNFKGIPQEGSMVGMMGGFGGGGTEVLNEAAAPEIPAAAPVEVKKTAAVFNRDFRALMKAVDKKVAAKKG